MIDGLLDWFKISVNQICLLFDIQLKPDQRRFVPSPIRLYRDIIFSGDKNAAPIDIFLIRLNNSPIGAFTLSVNHKGIAWLGGFQIDRQYQGKGVAAMVLKSICRCLTDLNKRVTSICLNVHKENRHAISFYSRNGFEIASSEVENKWIMKRNIDHPII